MPHKPQKMYALVCSDEKYTGVKDYLVCGSFPTKLEAKEWGKDVDGCLCDHLIKKCEVKIIEE